MTAIAHGSVQGAFLAKAQKHHDVRTSPLIALKRLKDACWAWRATGSLTKKYKDFLKAEWKSYVPFKSVPHYQILEYFIT
jgi:hypothetical protein